MTGYAGPESGQARRMSDLTRLIDRQQGMIARRQLSEHGVHWDHVRAHVVGGRCLVRTPRVVSAFTGELTADQRRWLAVLHAGPRAMLGALTAAEHHGLRRWERDTITVIVDDELAFEPVDGVRFFRSRRSFELLLDPSSTLPACRLEPAVLMWAGYDAPPRAAHAVLAAVVQQRLSTPVELGRWINTLKPLRRAPAFRETLSDIGGGAQSHAELDLTRLCRRFGLQDPVRQRPRLDSAGRRRFTDCEWELQDGSVLVLEIDGAFHMEVEHWTEDLRRSRRLTAARRTVVRCTAYEVRHEAQQLASDLLALGVPRRVPDTGP